MVHASVLDCRCWSEGRAQWCRSLSLERGSTLVVEMVRAPGLYRRRWSDGRAQWCRWCTLRGSIVVVGLRINLGGVDGARSGGAIVGDRVMYTPALGLKEE
eukprot:241441-Rhodomonas_salina.1